MPETVEALLAAREEEEAEAVAKAIDEEIYASAKAHNAPENIAIGTVQPHLPMLTLTFCIIIGGAEGAGRSSGKTGFCCDLVSVFGFGDGP